SLPLLCSRPVFSFNSHPPPQLLPPFPTRRSSDLAPLAAAIMAPPLQGEAISPVPARTAKQIVAPRERPAAPRPTEALAPQSETRSEEHTSELQSLTNLVCRLLLEKKNRQLNCRVL